MLLSIKAARYVLDFIEKSEDSFQDELGLVYSKVKRKHGTHNNGDEKDGLSKITIEPDIKAGSIG